MSGRSRGARAAVKGAALVLLLAGCGRAVELALPSRPTAIERVVVIGASLSAGFQLPSDLAGALEASLAGEHEPVLSHADNLLFLDPLHAGPAQVESALDEDPTLVIAIDYLFWFGYGLQGASGELLDSEAGRLELLERGLASLEPLRCPLVVSDFPDMSAAVGAMLLAEQVPDPGTLEVLSKRVREWASQREATIVLPLARTVQELDSGSSVRLGRVQFPEGTRLLQPDRLHPTPEGLTALVLLVADELVRADLAPELAFDFDPEGVLTELEGG